MVGISQSQSAAPGAQAAATTAAAAGGGAGADEDDKLFSLAVSADNVKSFGDQCAASWTEVHESFGDEADLVFRGVQVKIGLCAVVASEMEAALEPGEERVCYGGEPVAIATLLADAAQGGMLLIPQGTFRQLHLEMLSERCLVSE